jgi:U3 small nucleolar RNA-associated protein 11
MSSSMRNAAKAVAKPHRERGQVAERQRLGLLEKHKDYSKRAKDFNKKKAQLKSLRQKAADRNEDEFYFGMMSRSGAGSKLTREKGAFTGTIDGQRPDSVSLSVETVRLLKTQDMQYIRTFRNVAAKEVKELEERVALAGAQVLGVRKNVDDDEEEEDFGPSSKRAKKIVFAEDEQERDQTLLERTEADEEAEEESEADDSNEATEAEQKAEHLEKLRRKLLNARKKLKALDDAEQQLDAQRARMAKTATYGGITKSGKKIKIRERKR